MTVNLARNFVGQPPSRPLLITDIHLLVAFVAVERAAESFRRRVAGRFQLRQPAQQHVDLEDRPFVHGLRLVEVTRKPGQHVAAKVHQQILRFDRLSFARYLKLDAPFRPGQAECFQRHIRDHLGATLAGRRLQLSDQRPHPADRHLPFARLVPDEVVKETPVL